MDMKKMMKQAQKMQRDAVAVQEEVAMMEFNASAGGGMVSATVMGDNTLKSIHIDPEALDPEDTEMLEDMIVAAVNEAMRDATETANAKMNSIMGGLNMPGMPF